MVEKNDWCVVLFADVSGSTKLYEIYGDEVAKYHIDLCIQLMERVVCEYHGAVIKTIGDEVMCRFGHPDYAYLASCSMHELVGNHQELKKFHLAIRIGFHYGPVIVADSDIFGDTVNVAARVAGLSRANKTLITESVIDHLSADFADKTRLFDCVPVKGKSKPIETWEVLWKNNEDLTVMLTKPRYNSSNARLKITYQNQIYYASGDVPLVIGRSSEAGVIVKGATVSRTHVSINYHRGNFILTDKSTNGCYVKTSDGEVFFLKNEQMILLSHGAISLGKPFSEDSAGVLHYQVESSD